MLLAKPIHIVDDDIGFLKGIVRLLEALDLKVRAFASVEEFQAQANPDDAACLILDIHLGAVSGIQLMQEILLSGTQTPVVLITANDSERTRLEAWGAGCSAFLLKPISAKALMNAVLSVTHRNS